MALEGFAYPYPVRYKDVTIQREDLRMAYMDVAPTGPANGRSVLLRLGTAIALLPPRSAFPQRTCRHSQAGGGHRPRTGRASTWPPRGGGCAGVAGCDRAPRTVAGLGRAFRALRADVCHARVGHRDVAGGRPSSPHSRHHPADHGRQGRGAARRLPAGPPFDGVGDRHSHRRGATSQIGGEGRDRRLNLDE